MFKTYKDKIQMEGSIGKNPAKYKTIRKATNIYEQKPVNIDDFIDSEEAEVKERVEKQKTKKTKKRREVAEKNKLLKKRERPRKIKKRTCGNV